MGWLRRTTRRWLLNLRERGRRLRFSGWSELRCALLISCATLGARSCRELSEPEKKPPPPGLRGEIVFVSNREGGQIYAISPSGGPMRNLSNLPPQSGKGVARWVRLYARWSPNGRYIAFRGPLENRGARQVWLMRPDGSDRRPVTDLPTSCFDPTPSADGKTISYMCYHWTREEGSKFWVGEVPVGGGPERRLFTAPPGFEILSNGGVSADGRKLLLCLGESARIPHWEGFDIYLFDLKTGDLQRLTPGRVFNRDPCWSPDYTRIAFSSTRDGTRDQIYIMNADGSDQGRVTSDWKTHRSPSWSPDGKYLVFERYRRSMFSGIELFVLDIASGEEYQLTRAIRLKGRRKWSWDMRPSWGLAQTGPAQSESQGP